MITENPPHKLKYRSIFISDVHLGFRGFQQNSSATSCTPPILITPL